MIRSNIYFETYIVLLTKTAKENFKRFICASWSCRFAWHAGVQPGESLATSPVARPGSPPASKQSLPVVHRQALASLEVLRPHSAT